MKVCQVIGSIIATEKHPAFAGHSLMIVQPVDENGNEVGTSFIAVDRVQSGPGDRVLVLTEGSGVRQILDKGAIVPIRSAVVGIVDEVTLG